MHSPYLKPLRKNRTARIFKVSEIFEIICRKCRSRTSISFKTEQRTDDAELTERMRKTDKFKFNLDVLNFKLLRSVQNKPKDNFLYRKLPDL